MSVFVERFIVGKKTHLIVAVKGNIDVEGFVTNAGSAAYGNKEIAVKNADVVDDVLNASCQLIGKLNMHELAFGMTGVNSYLGTPLNYHFPHYITGGSSSGCAVAVAEESVDFSIGTDTGGSIRVPAACCGVFGLKPTFGRVSRKGILPTQSTLDCVGPLAQSASKIIVAMQAMDSTFKPLNAPNTIRLGQVIVSAEKEISTELDNRLAKHHIATEKVYLPSFEQAFEAALVLMNSEMWNAFGHLLKTGKLGDDVAQRLLAAQDTSPDRLHKSEQVRQIFTDEVDRALSNVDALVLPTLASFPLSREAALAGESDLIISSLTRPFNLSGHPAITIPLCNKAGKPMAMQIVGAKGKDELICSIAKKLSESSTINTAMLEKNNV